MTPTTPKVRCAMADEPRRYVVRCIDGTQRHDTPFLTRREAEEFAEWGHVCIRTHTIEEATT